MVNLRLRDLLTKGVEFRYSLMQAGLYYLCCSALCCERSDPCRFRGPSWLTCINLAFLTLYRASTQQFTSENEAEKNRKLYGKCGWWGE